MNKIDIQQTGGFPLETDTLNAMQNAYDVFNSLGSIIAPLAIVKGCEIVGNQVSNGVVYINGEVLEFRGGQAGVTVIIREETKNKNFENGENKLVYRTRYATFGSSAQTTNYPWSDFHRPMTIKEIQKRLMPVGCIVLDYYGRIEDIPSGYVLCNGENGTPDLRGMFIVGYNPDNPDYNAIGKTGGEKEVTLTVNQLPAHKHSGSTSQDGSHSHQTFVDRDEGYIGDPTSNYGVNRRRRTSDNSENYTLTRSSTTQEPTVGKTSTSGSHSHTFETNEVGGNAAHENRPPFYVLAKIMYKG